MLRLKKQISANGSIAILAGACALLLASEATSRAADPDLKEIADTLNKWRASFVTLHVVWETRNPEDVKLDAPEWAAKGLLETVFNRCEWTWTDYGAARWEDSLFAHGRLHFHRVEGWDGRRLESFGADFAVDTPRPQDPKQISLLRMRSAKPSSAMAIRPLTNVYFEGTVRWLGECLAAAEAKLEGYENKDGVRCARVRLISSPYRDQILWLDPNHSFLVYRSSEPMNEKSVGEDFAVQEFQRLDSGVPFPRKGTYSWKSHPGRITYWVVATVEVNKPCDDTLFRAPQPVQGTLMQNARTGRIYRVGSKADPASIEAQMAENAKANVPESADRVSAVPPESRAFMWSGVLLIVCVSLLLVGLWLRLRM